MVQYLLARGFDPKERDIDGLTPIDLASAKRKQRKELKSLEDLLTLSKPATDVRLLAMHLYHYGDD